MQILLMQQGKFLLLGIKKRQIMCKNRRHLIRKFTGIFVMMQKGVHKTNSLWTKTKRRKQISSDQN
jgi:hypothetical protein